MCLPFSISGSCDFDLHTQASLHGYIYLDEGVTCRVDLRTFIMHLRALISGRSSRN